MESTFDDAYTLGVNAIFLKPTRVGGAQQMAIALCHALAQTAPQNASIIILTTSDAARELQWPNAPNVTIVPIDLRWHRVIAEPIALRRSPEVNVWLNLNYYTPPFSRRPHVTVILDAQHRQFPENFSWTKRAWLRFAHAMTLSRAQTVIAISRSVAEALRGQHPRHAHRIRVAPAPVVIPPAIGSSTVTADDSSWSLLAVAAHYPHKNLKTLVQSLPALRERYPGTILTLVGQLAENLVGGREGIDDDLVGNGIRVLGYLPDDELREAYNQADVFLAPSLFEGFGLTVIEALAAGLPVIATHLAVYDELAPAMAKYVEAPESSSSWAAAILEVLVDPLTHVPTKVQRDWLREQYSPRRVGLLYWGLLSSTLQVQAGWKVR
jgi:glycosyltransferase involved in cell wall biosynthesis